MSAALKYPAPAELDADALAGRDLALAVARAVAERHPGPQYDHTVDGHVVTITAKHPAHNWTIGLDLSNPKNTGSQAVTQARLLAMDHLLSHWASRLLHVMRGTQVTNADGHAMPLEAGFQALQDLMRKVKGSSSKFVMVGNGGSAAIASHMAEDFTKNGGVRSVTFNDAAMLTCFANDHGWAQVFGSAVEYYGHAGDVLIALSSSGKSENIINAAKAAKAKAMTVVTLSGFALDNPLRKAGTLNFYVPSHQYGFVETAHQGILHAALDLMSGWVGQQ